MPLERTVEPEWLDALPADDPRAVASRRDLRRVNGLMGHARIIARALQAHLATDAPKIAELGAGDGTLLAKVAVRAQWRGAEIVLVDRAPAVGHGTLERYAALGCRARAETADVFEWLTGTRARYDAIVANLFLHHFDAHALGRLLSAAAMRTSLFVACEPRRARLPLAGSRMLGALGCNDVTRHDARLSVRAGFAGTEISDAWPRGGEWLLTERRAGFFSHLFVAQSKTGSAPDFLQKTGSDPDF